MSEKKPYDTTLARIAGNIAAGLLAPLAEAWDTSPVSDELRDKATEFSVDLAQRIVRRLTTTVDRNARPCCPKCGAMMAPLDPVAREAAGR